MNSRRRMCPLTDHAQGYRFLTRSGDSRFKAALGKGLVNDCLNRLVVFNNENYKLVFQRSTPGCPAKKHQAEDGSFVPREMSKSILKRKCAVPLSVHLCTQKSDLISYCRH